ncbi:MAG: hypothetical protein A2915_00885 [Candidatus Yanofskybacteria bacterium RIFCSPLOWO2_01_FULL_41_34]|uniref:LSM domain-containing protein n=1 Tax=Candidatus Yanofskybacteria bacterium RIFCSPHIGHO2_01_FULL_41_26 TaxID=1802661 RepID=A0A1F8EC55_9BACT|nr:MAG: hypothetical protein A2649_02920 [Candidatus Yanofskybacteria bacterium RIFCSPHIGHO2_01_FULL_41_26]OGN22448.1 MAG: hypothetical protein A2915_00885 [Candidatus Yanofskybacteria bacterium RIFCSPLOWO2_01_FULL_41_34]
MTLGLSKKWIDKMKSLPESGMGHQSVEVKLKNGIILRGTVMNSNILKVDGYVIFKNDDIDDINVL